MAFHTYILANHRNGAIYVGTTDDLGRRIVEHKERARPGFSATYGCDKLVWSETHETRNAAFSRETAKEWRRSRKLMMIEASNPTWNDLYRSFNA